MLRLKLVTSVLATALLAGVAVAQNHAPADTLDATRLDAVTVTGTRSEKLLAETPVRTELVDRTEITAAGSQTLADAVEFTPGVRVLNSCQNCNFTSLSLLGLEGKYTQVLFDSQPVYSGLSLVYGLEQIPAQLMERVEIVKGGGSSLYGPGAVGGVVNVIPREALESGVSATARYEDINGTPGYSVGFTADAVSRDGKSAVAVYGQGNENDAYDRNGDGFSDIAERKLSALGFRARRETFDGGRVTVDYSRIFEDRRGGDQLDQPPFRAEIAEWIRNWRNTASLSWRQPWSENVSTDIAVAYAATERKTYYGGGMDPNAYGNTDNPLTVLDARLNHYLGDHALTYGVGYTSDHIDDQQPAYDRQLDETYTNTGVYVQDDWMISEPLALVLGLRLDDHSELEDPVLSPRVALRWSATHDIKLRAAFSRGFLAPTVFDEDLHIAVVGGEAQVIVNEDGLKEESSTSYTLGVEATPRLGSGFARFEANLFRTDLDRAFALRDDLDDPATPEAELVRVNAGGAMVQGVETTVGWLNDRFEVQLGWVFQQGEYDDPQDFDETDFFRLPDSYGILKAYYRDPAVVDVFLGARYLGSEKVPHYAGWIGEDRLEETDSFLVLDLSLSRCIPIGEDGVRLTIGARNLTDDYQEDLDEGPDRDSGYLYGPRYPRTLYGSVGYDF